jgi:hypothetical protein
MFFNSRADQIGKARFQILKDLFEAGAQASRRHPLLQKKYEELISESKELFDMQSTIWFITAPDKPNSIRNMSDDQFRAVAQQWAQVVDDALHYAELLSGQISEPLHILLFKDLQNFTSIEKLWDSHSTKLALSGFGKNEFIIKTAIFRFLASYLMMGLPQSSIPVERQNEFLQLSITHLSKDKEALEFFQLIHRAFFEAFKSEKVSPKELYDGLPIFYESMFAGCDSSRTICQDLLDAIGLFTHNALANKSSA